MSDLAYIRFETAKMLTPEEEQHKDEMIRYTEEVMAAKGIECDATVEKLSLEEIRKILEEARRLRRRKKNLTSSEGSIELEDEQQHDKEEVLVAGE
jgi:hypothetical protein